METADQILHDFVTTKLMPSLDKSQEVAACRSRGIEFILCRVLVYSREVKGDDVPVHQYSKDYPLLKVPEEKINFYTLENCTSADSIPVPDEMLKAVSCEDYAFILAKSLDAILVCRVTDSYNFTVTTQLPLPKGSTLRTASQLIYQLPSCVDELDKKVLRRLSPSLKSNGPLIVLVLHGETSNLIIPIMHCPQAFATKVTVYMGDIKYKLTDFKNGEFLKIKPRKEIKQMSKGLPNPLAGSLAASEPEVNEQPVVEPQVPAQEEQVTDVAPTPDEPVKEQVSESVSRPAEEVKQEETTAKPRTRTRRAVVAPTKDLKSTIEYLSAPVDAEQLTVDNALEAIRQLRDLQKAAASRIANIATAMISNQQEAGQQLAQLRQALKGIKIC